MGSQTKSFWGQIARRALLASGVVLGIHSKPQIALWIAGAIIIVLGLLFLGTENSAWDELKGRLFFVAVIALVFPFIFIWKCFSVPAEVHAEQSSRIAELEANLVPRITISDPIETTHPKPPGKIFTRFVSIEIENISHEQIRNCMVKEVRFTNVHGFDSEINGRIFRIARERNADFEAAIFTEKFDLNGKGAKQIVDIASLVERHDGGGDNTNVFMMYAANATMGLFNSIPRSFFPHVIAIQVEADNLPVPVQKTFKLLVSPDGYLKMETKF